MRRYSRSEEDTIRARALIVEWERSGLLQPSQKQHLEATLQIDLKQTNLPFRGMLFLFGVIIAVALLWFIAEAFSLRDDFSMGIACFGMATTCFAVGDALVRRSRLYRFGIEEALLCTAVVLLGVSAALMLTNQKAFVAVAVSAAAGVALFQMFGFVYAAIASTICAAMLPFTINLSGEVQRLLAAAMFIAVLLVLRPLRLLWNDDFPGDDYALIQASSLVGAYGVLNLHWSSVPMYFRSSGDGGWFYWLTYLAIWILPVVGLWLSIPTKDRPLMNVSGALLLVTLITNKPYWGMTRHPWDPILLGVLLIVVVLTIKRWLSKGVNRERFGFTADRLLDGDKKVLDFVATASAAFQPIRPVAENPEGYKPGGGRSGGAGATGTF